MALVKYNDRSIRNLTTAPAAATSSPGALVHIKTVTASSSSTVTFVNGTSDVVLDSTYPIYKVKMINVHPSSEQKFYVNFRDGSTAYDATKTTTNFRAYHFERDNEGDAGLGYQDGLDLAQATGDQMIGQEISTNNDASGCGELYLFNPSSTTFVKHFLVYFEHMYTNSAPGPIDNYTAGYCNTTTAIDGIQFKFASGNIDSGIFELYGIKDS
jgi:hypothetical protein